MRRDVSDAGLRLPVMGEKTSKVGRSLRVRFAAAGARVCIAPVTGTGGGAILHSFDWIRSSYLNSCEYQPDCND